MVTSRCLCLLNLSPYPPLPPFLLFSPRGIRVFFWSIFAEVVKETGVPLEGVLHDLEYEYMTDSDMI